LFTGLVEEVGTIESIHVSGSGRDLMIRVGIVSQDAEMGDSIAINGCCLTVTAISNAILTFQAGSETLSRSNLGLLNPGDSVNLERSLRVGDRMGGHYVTGHVDGLATVDVRVDDGAWSEFWFRLPRELTRQLASKGSVAVDGISLTLVNVELERFSVALIPHTLQVTTLGQRKVGDQVNIETDLLAKYVQQQLTRSELDTSS
jgi:riboflavin synthase